MPAPVYTTSNPGFSAGIVNFASGKMVTDAGTPAAAYVVACGFTPRYVRWVNVTDLMQDEWFEGMAADSSLHQVAAGTGTLPVSGGITVSTGQFSIAAGINPPSKTFYWQAMG